MNTDNTFTYRHSDLPLTRAEIKFEIAALDALIADLILKIVGNYRELTELREILDNCLDSCELNLNSIRIIADDSPEPSPISMIDLPMNQKQIIFSTAIGSSIAVGSLASMLDVSPEDMVLKISALVQNAVEAYTDEQVNAVIEGLLVASNKENKRGFYKIKIPDN